VDEADHIPEKRRNKQAIRYNGREMKTLIINTALPQTEIALIEGDEIIFADAWTSNYDEAQQILNRLEKIIPKKIAQNAKTTAEKPASIDEIFVVEGPGAFTGLRVGVTVANTLAFVYGVKIRSCDTFTYLLHKIPQSHAESTAIMLCAGRQVALSIPLDKKIHKIEKDELKTFLAHHKKICYIISDVRKENRKDYPLPKDIKWIEAQALSTCAKTVLSILKTNPPQHKQVKPKYLAPPHITKSKKQICA